MSSAEPNISDIAYTLNHYGDRPSQFVEVILPEGHARGVVVVIHGGYWRAKYDADLGLPLAADLARRGWAAVNLEYRRTESEDPEDAGGWPATFEDVAAGIDHIRKILPETYFDLPVFALGHSAGGHLAAWAASRPDFASGTVGADPVVAIDGVLSQAGVLDLHQAYELELSHGAAQLLMGSTPEEDPEAWKHADPTRLVPSPVDVVVLHPEADESVPASVAHSYCEAAAAAGGDPRFRAIPGDHLSVVDVESRAWQMCIKELDRLAEAHESKPAR